MKITLMIYVSKSKNKPAFSTYYNSKKVQPIRTITEMAHTVKARAIKTSFNLKEKVKNVFHKPTVQPV